MRRALRLAARGRGSTSPNPMVGASVVAADGTVVGDGWHHEAGTPHAEVHALAEAGARARGATLICTLEPCCHHGRTGPCVEQIAAAGIREVVVATLDPNPQVAGGGIRYLQDHGLRAVVGPLGPQARRLNAEFFTVMRTGRPYVVLKAGVSLDGAVAAAPGQRTEITGPAARRRVQRLRAEVDAVAVGSGTVLTDDPLLTVRDVYRKRPLARVVFDRRLRMPAQARLLSTIAQGPVLVLTSPAASRSAAADALRAAGAEVTSDDDLAAGLRRLASRGISSVLLEGGPTVQRAAWEAGMIDRVVLFVSPRAIGPGGVPLADGEGPSTAGLHDLRVESCGEDVMVHGYVHRVD